MNFLGLDTSNYTTSTAIFSDSDDCQSINKGKLLSVKAGGLGLRQSEALFQHIKNLPENFEYLKEQGVLNNIKAIGVSTRPRAVEGSYMPCFLAGISHSKALANILNVPLFEFSHQQGHIVAVCWSANQMELLEKPFLAWHLSGGTTELLLVTPDNNGNVNAECIGGTTDISAGQLIDRTGQKLGLQFPSGKALDRLALSGTKNEYFKVKISDLKFSLSGMENKIIDLINSNALPENVARYALMTVAMTVLKTTQKAQEKYKGLPVLCSGGVASNTILRQIMSEAVFAKPEYSTDNAMGIAVLAKRFYEYYK